MVHECDGGQEEVSKDGWSGRFFNKIGMSCLHLDKSRSFAGLEQMVKDDFEQLGGIPGKNGLVLTAGQPVGKGLSKEAAEELGLVEGTAVGSGVIDAYAQLIFALGVQLIIRYAGWIGTVAATSAPDGLKPPTTKPSFEEASSRLAAIAGTSTCHIAQSKQGILVPGVVRL